MGCVAEDLKNRLVRQKEDASPGESDWENLQPAGFKDFPCGPMPKNPRFHSGVVGSIQGQGTKIPHAMQCGQKINK